jgi:hypothetical protein
MRQVARREHSILARLQLLAYDFHGAKHAASGLGDSQSRHRLILDGLVDGSLHIANELFDVLGDVSRLIGRLVSQPAPSWSVFLLTFPVLRPPPD